MPAPIISTTLYGVPGDVPAEARLVVTEEASQVRRYAEYGCESRYLAEAAAANGGVAPPLEIDSGSLVTSGFGGPSTTRTGSFNTNVIRGSLFPTAIAVCGLGTQRHLGTYRVRARCYVSSTAVFTRLAWSEG